MRGAAWTCRTSWRCRCAPDVGEAILALAGARAHAADDVLRDADLPTLLADEGGLSPGCDNGRAALRLMVEAIERSGPRPGEDIAIAVDVAATTLKQRDACYRLSAKIAT